MGWESIWGDCLLMEPTLLSGVSLGYEEAQTDTITFKQLRDLTEDQARQMLEAIR